MPIPDFLIVGAPKCGTTALHRFLAEHPALYMGKKEYHHFGRDLRPPEYIGERWDRAAYEAQFAAMQADQLAGDASVWYLLSHTAATEIAARNPDARILIMLRNPTDLMYSLYNMFTWVRDLTPNGVIEAESGRLLSFEEALDTQDERKVCLARDGDPRAVVGDRTLRLFHTDVAMFSPQVARYLDAFPREQIHVVVHDDLTADPAGTYRNVLRFLGVQEEFTPTFKRVNSARDIKNVTLHRILNDRRALPALRRIVRLLVPKSIRHWGYLKAHGANVETRPQPPMAETTRRSLQDHFRADVERLSHLLDRDLTTRWYPVEAEDQRLVSRLSNPVG